MRVSGLVPKFFVRRMVEAITHILVFLESLRVSSTYRNVVYTAFIVFKKETGSSELVNGFATQKHETTFLISECEAW